MTCFSRRFGRTPPGTFAGLLCRSITKSGLRSRRLRDARRTALDAVTVKILKEHRKNQLEQRLAAGADYRDNDLVFCETYGSPIQPQAASDRFDRIVERAGLPRISMKGLRHTHATLALKAGVPVKAVSERLGHASTSFTMDTYAHVLPGCRKTPPRWSRASWRARVWNLAPSPVGPTSPKRRSSTCCP
jgi:integrase